MSQYIAGTIQLVQGDQTVIGTSTSWLSNVGAGDVLCPRGDKVGYEIGSVTDDTHLELVSPYAGASKTGQSYSITTSITPIYGFPYPEQGDIDTATLFKRLVLMLEALFSGADEDSSVEFEDLLFAIRNRASPRGRMQFSADLITAGSTRTLTIPDGSGTLVLAALAQVLTNKTLDVSSLTLEDLSISPSRKATLSLARLMDGANRSYQLPEPLEDSVLGYLNLPQVEFVANTTLNANHSGKLLVHPSSDNNARTITIPHSELVNFRKGTAFSVCSMKNTVTIALDDSRSPSDIMYREGTGSTGSRTLAVYGLATFLKIGNQEWLACGGANLT